MPRFVPFVPLPLALAALLVLAGCDHIVPEELTTVNGIISSATAVGATSALLPGTPGQSSGAPAAAASGNQSMIPGGGTGFEISAASPFTHVYIWVEGETGYYRINLGAARDLAEIILTYANELESSLYNFRFAVGTDAGHGAPDARAMSVISVGTGDVQVSVSWDVPSDVDLYVVDPSGEEIFYGNRSSASGGELDLDSNAGCGGLDVRNENVTWAEGTAPRGEYTVRVNYWSACGQTRTNWVVTVRAEGHPTRTYSGSFTGEGNGGFSGAGEVVTTFVY
jgi:hypothetical protein